MREDGYSLSNKTSFHTIPHSKMDYSVIRYYDSSDILQVLMKHPDLRSNPDFYKNLAPEELEKSIAAIFQPSGQIHEKYAPMMFGTLKDHAVLATIMLQKQYNINGLLIYLEEVPLRQAILVFFQEIMLPLVRKKPQQFLLLLERDEPATQRLLKKIYLRQIYKFFYTIVFCLDAKSTSPLIDKILGRLLELAEAYQPSQKPDSIDYAQIASNLKELLNDLAVNLAAISNNRLKRMFQLTDEPHLKSILSLAVKFVDHEEEFYSEGLLQYLIGYFTLYQKFKAETEHLKSSARELDHKRRQVIELVVSTLKVITSFIPQMYQVLLTSCPKKVAFSSGELIPKFGIGRYRMLQLIHKILEIDLETDLKIDYECFDLFIIVSKALEKNKWCNMVHITLEKIVRICLERQYALFKDRYLSIGNYSDSILSALIQAYRNRKFFFLRSMNSCDFGNRHAIYEISKSLTSEMEEEGDLQKVTTEFPVWGEFTKGDLQEYQKSLVPSKMAQKLQLTKFKGLMNSLELGENRQYVPFDSISQHIEDDQKWSITPDSNRKKKRRESLCSFDILSQIDNLKTDATK